MPNPTHDRLSEQLYYLPAIIERLGIGICEAQKGLNLDYITSLGRLMEIIKDALGPDGSAQAKAAIMEMLRALAASRYQFTETTVAVRAHLSTTMNFGGQAGIAAGVGACMGAVMVNASFAVAFGYDYRAAAEIKTVLHAIPADEALVTTLLQRPAPAVPALPDKTKLDHQVLTTAKDLPTALRAALPAPGEGG